MNGDFEEEFTPGDEHDPTKRKGGGELPPPSAGAADDKAGPNPVTLLGSENGRYSFLTPSGEDRYISGDGFSKGAIIDLYQARTDWLYKKFGIEDRDGNIKGWSHQAVNEYLVRESARLPLFNPQSQMRGPGVWMEEGDNDVPDHCVVHHGDGIYINLPEAMGGGFRKPCRYRNMIYALRPPEPKPAAKESTTADAARLLELVRSWNWNRPTIDPILLIGWVALATVCGALDWRPSLWIAGDRATGKSTLQDLIRRVLGKILVRAAEPTEAYMRQTLRGAARPVELDEFEAEEQVWKRQQIFNLIRIGSTRGGPGIGRGSADGKAVEYNIDAIFLCSSILRPSMKSADLQRFSVLELSPLNSRPEDTIKVQAAIRTFAGMGMKIARRMLDRWDQFQESMAMFKPALARIGHGSRSADQYAPLLAAADILLHDEVIDTAAANDMVSILEPAAIADAVGDVSDSEACLKYLLTSSHPDWGGKVKPSVANLIQTAARLELARKAPDESDYTLQGAGLRVGRWPLTEGDPAVEMCLAVSITHRQLAKLYEGTVWATSSGRAGGWAQSLRRLGNVPAGSRNVRLHGVPTKCILVPLYNLDIDLEPEPEAATQAADAGPDGSPNPPKDFDTGGVT